MWRLKLLHPKYNCTYAHLLTYNQNIKKKKNADTQTRCNCWTKLFNKIILHGKNVRGVF